MLQSAGVPDLAACGAAPVRRVVHFFAGRLDIEGIAEWAGFGRDARFIRIGVHACPAFREGFGGSTVNEDDSKARTQENAVQVR